jgi:hypothetical protein
MIFFLCYKISTLLTESDKKVTDLIVDGSRVEEKEETTEEVLPQNVSRQYTSSSGFIHLSFPSSFFQPSNVTPLIDASTTQTVRTLTRLPHFRIDRPNDENDAEHDEECPPDEREREREKQDTNDETKESSKLLAVIDSTTSPSLTPPSSTSPTPTPSITPSITPEPARKMTLEMSPSERATQFQNILREIIKTETDYVDDLITLQAVCLFFFFVFHFFFFFFTPFDCFDRCSKNLWNRSWLMTSSVSYSPTLMTFAI